MFCTCHMPKKKKKSSFGIIFHSNPWDTHEKHTQKYRLSHLGFQYDLWSDVKINLK